MPVLCSSHICPVFINEVGNVCIILVLVTGVAGCAPPTTSAGQYRVAASIAWSTVREGTRGTQVAKSGKWSGLVYNVSSLKKCRK